MLSTKTADLPAKFEGPPTYEILELRKALLTEELEKRKTGGELVSFGFSASNACSSWIPLHHLSGSAIQPDKSSPRVRWAKFSNRVVPSTRSQKHETIQRSHKRSHNVHIRYGAILDCGGTIAARIDRKNMADMKT